MVAANFSDKGIQQSNTTVKEVTLVIIEFSNEHLVVSKEHMNWKITKPVH
jgi:hypothetical protein